MVALAASARSSRFSNVSLYSDVVFDPADELPGDSTSDLQHATVSPVHGFQRVYIIRLAAFRHLPADSLVGFGAFGWVDNSYQVNDRRIVT